MSYSRFSAELETPGIASSRWEQQLEKKRIFWRICLHLVYVFLWQYWPGESEQTESKTYSIDRSGFFLKI